MTSSITLLLTQITPGDPKAAEQLLPLVYDELRRLAAAKLAQEKPGQTLQATALVHDTYLRLVGGDVDQKWDIRRPNSSWQLTRPSKSLVGSIPQQPAS